VVLQAEKGRKEKGQAARLRAAVDFSRAVCGPAASRRLARLIFVCPITPPKQRYFGALTRFFFYYVRKNRKYSKIDRWTSG